jgi:LysM repeat protein
MNAMQGIAQQAPLLVNPTSWDKCKEYVQQKLGLSNEQVQTLNDAGKVIGNLFKCVLYGAGAGFLIYEMIVGGGNVVDKVINGLNLGVMSLGLLVGSIEGLFALKIGEFIEGQLAASTSQMGKFALNLTKWVGGGLPGEMGWITKVFTTSAADFIKFRIGPALAFLGLAVSGYQLYKAIKSGDVRNITFESLNAFIGLVAVASIGLELFSVAWAGPAGLVIAVIGGIIALIQMIWNIVSPPTPPPDPIELFVKGPLTDEGFTKFPRKYTPKAGDTVTIVAKQFYGPHDKEPERPRPGLRLAPKKLYEANRDVVGPNIDIVLKPEQVLSIPHVVKYIWQPGDEYSTIAKKIYGSSDKSSKLLADNLNPGDPGLPAGAEVFLWDVP